VRILDWARSEGDRRLLWVASLLPILGAVASLSLAGRFASNRGLLTALLLIGGLSWFLAVVLARRDAGNFRMVVVGAVALRLLAWSGSPGLSDDAYRYLWEGAVVLEGASPYAFAPDATSGPGAEVASELRERHHGLFERLNHKDVAAAYPPLAQAVGAVLAAFCRFLGLPLETAGVALLRAFCGACDLLVLWPLFKLLERAGQPRALAVLWGWCPLPAVEFAGAGHLDSLGILLLTGALAVGGATSASPNASPADGRLRGLALTLLAAGILSKYLPALALPWFLRGRRALAAAVWVAPLCAAGFAPFLWLGGSARGVFSGLGEYAFRWEAASLLHRWIEPIFDAWFLRDESWSDPRRLARITEGVAWLAVAVAVIRRQRDPLRGVAALFGGWILLSPTLHPWYLCWMLPFIGWRAPWAWTWLVLAAPLLYWPLVDWQRVGVWAEPSWLWPIVALPFLGILLFERTAAARRLRSGSVTAR